ncbi:antitoxin Xre/MbcA/ParS toxin-binding domain-containing protein [Pseudovibrio sp. Tun.PSC04-5.I4]|uniref:type II RES/Xre toxin-antitoxin system antitoxin n=1 Tax=Pseudovibrio sp. Tun.PSC04-5.I4 TaxID=1798213 RepID=UPI00088575C6|nr:antitoxin Xre/MbcA/ParS toxin-binding domain-containing protein [Pseudovibrio sp. Tun.PSC04-5.I4]SDR49089.1 putative toxin-antitoxin system antitoxin component, TIGR02293 family [Pseudovibrio sp. Tun.PSC04-5.I4]
MARAVKVESDVTRTYDLLGGNKIIRSRINNALDAHDVLVKGLPSASLLYLVKAVEFLERDDALLKAIGVSVRTLQRRKADEKTKLLSVEQSNRTWRFAEILGHAIKVLGSKEEAETWLNRPALGLSNRKPLDLLATSAGVEAVEEYLTRIEYGVYS